LGTVRVRHMGFTTRTFLSQSGFFKVGGMLTKSKPSELDELGLFACVLNLAEH